MTTMITLVKNHVLKISKTNIEKEVSTWGFHASGVKLPMPNTPQAL
jgi:hypothetical protein